MHCVSTTQAPWQRAHCSGMSPCAGVSTRWSAKTKARNISGKAGPSSTSGARPGSRRASGWFPAPTTLPRLRRSQIHNHRWCCALGNWRRTRFQKTVGFPGYGLLRQITLSIKCLGAKALPDPCILVSKLSSGKRGAMEMSGGIPNLGPSGHIDDFARRNLPPFHQWPELLLDRPEFQYPEYLNAGVELTDRLVEKGLGDRIALIGNGRQRT